ncbi:hypothetical protein BU17DRAFT_45848, partial [Hysterangium stoloniferum]
AVTVTSVRLVLRIRSSTVWWDDALVFLAIVFSTTMSAATGMHYGDPYAYSRSARLAAYYLIAEGFYLALWTTRLSILYSIIRIVPGPKQKRFLYGAAIAFTTVLVLLLAQVFWVCEAPGKWKLAPNPQCPLGLQVAVCQLITDIIADILLIVVPVRLLTSTSLERGLKIRLVIIFSATMLTTVVGLVHAAYLLEVRGIDAIVSAVVEVAVCIVVCNLVVLVPALYRVLGWRNVDDQRRAEPTFKNSTFNFRVGRNTTVMTGPTMDTILSTAMDASEGTATSGQFSESESPGKKIEQVDI